MPATPDAGGIPELQVRREGHGSEQPPQSVSSQECPGHSAQGLRPWIRLYDPISVHFSQVLSSLPCILEGDVMRIGRGLLWSVCNRWSETLLQRQEKNLLPKII